MDPTRKELGSDDDLNSIMKQHKVDIPSISYIGLRQPPHLPCADLLSGSREDHRTICVPLYEASIKGDWKTAKLILDRRPELIRFSITENGDTALHVAASAARTKVVEDFVENLVGMMRIEDLELQNKNYNTAFFLAAAAGNVKVANIMVRKNKALMDIPGRQDMMPLYVAALFGKRDMVEYLYENSQKMTSDFWTDKKRGWVFLKCVEVNFFDVALKMVKDQPSLSTTPGVLDILAQKPDAFSGIKPHKRIWRIIRSILHLKVGSTEEDTQALQLLRIIWSRILEMPKMEIERIIRGPVDPITAGALQKYSRRVLFVAAEMGNTKFLVELIRTYPDLIWKLNDENQSIFHVAVIHRQASIYNLLYEIGSMKDLITPLRDRNDNNMLHLVGKTSKNILTQNVSGGSLLMQRELLWFKEVETMMPPSYGKSKNKDGLTPYELFSKNNEALVFQSLNWMKDCMLAATLIVTVTFAAAFTVPGGYNQDNGIPMFFKEWTFLVFVIADAISLFSASASLLIFLSILTSRYGPHDFLESLPRKLMIGLGTLFISITAMMVTFSVSFFVLYHNRLKWIPILISLFAAMPVILFATLQYPLLADMFRSTYDSGYLFKPKKRMLYYQNPIF